MKNFPLFFCGIFFTLAFSWAGLVLAGHIQLGSLNTTTERIDGETGKPVKGNPLYPAAPTGLAMQGKQVYMSMGCIYCHTQQVRRQGVGADYERGWGDRQSVARDYIWEDRVLLGAMRTGPDNISIWDISGLIGIGGLLVWAFLNDAKKTAPIPLRDPRIMESLTHHE